MATALVSYLSTIYSFFWSVVYSLWSASDHSAPAVVVCANTEANEEGSTPIVEDIEGVYLASVGLFLELTVNPLQSKASSKNFSRQTIVLCQKALGARAEKRMDVPLHSLVSQFNHKSFTVVLSLTPVRMQRILLEKM
jgi:hypothetical protein